MQMPPNVRGDCDNLICFRQKQAEDVELLVESQGPEFGVAGSLTYGRFMGIVADEFISGTAWIKNAGAFQRV